MEDLYERTRTRLSAERLRKNHAFAMHSARVYRGKAAKSETPGLAKFWLESALEEYQTARCARAGLRAMGVAS